MNTFLTLMENYNDALELEQEALNNRGVVDDKYQIWLEGAEAAQNDLKNSAEELYGVLSADFLAGAYSGLAKFVEILAGATKATKGLNITIPLLAAGILMVASAVGKLVQMISTFSIAQMSNYVGAILALVTMVATAIGTAIYQANSFKDLERLNEKISQYDEQANRYKELQKELDELKNKTILTKEEAQRYNEIRDELIALSPSLAKQFDLEKSGLEGVAEAANLAAAGYQNAKEAKEKQTYWNISEIADATDKQIKDIKKAKNRLMLELTGQWDDPQQFLSVAMDANADPDGLYYNANKILNKKIENEGLDRFRQYLKAIEAIYKNPKQDMMSDSQKKDIDKVHEYVQAMVDTAESEIQDAIADGISSMLPGLFSDSRLKNIFEQNSIFETLLAEFFNSDNFAANFDEATPLKNVYAIMESFVETMILAADHMDPTQLFKGENPIAQMLLNSMVSGDTSSLTVDTAIPVIADILDGITQETADGLADQDLGVVSEVAHQYRQKINDIWWNMMSDQAPFEKISPDDFFEKADAGEFTWAMLEAYEEIYDAIKDDPNFAEKRNELMAAMMQGEEAFFEWKVKVHPDPEVDDAALTSFIEQLNNEIDDIWENGPQLEDGLTLTDEAFVKSERLIGILARLQEIQARTSETNLFGGDVSLDQFDAILAKMNALSELYSEMQSGEFDGTGLADIIESVPELEEFLGENEDTTAAVSELYGYFKDQIISIAEALGITIPGLEEFEERLNNILSPTDAAVKGIEELAKTNRLSVGTIEEIANAYPDLKKELKDFGDKLITAEELTEKLNKAYQDDSIREFRKNLEGAIEDVDGAVEGTVAYEEAMIALGRIFTDNQFSNLDAFDFASQNIDSIREAVNGSVEAFHELQNAAWINIVGTANVDFSAATNGLALVGDDAIRVGNLLASVGLGTIEHKELTSKIQYLEADGNGFAIREGELKGTQAIWKPSSNNPFAKSGGGRSSGGGGGGGGGGSRKTSVSSSTSKLLEGMEKDNEPFDNKLRLAELKKEYHEIRGEIQGMIAYAQIESEIIADQNRVLEQNISELEAEIKAKEEIMANNKKSSKAYKQAEIDLAELNKAHMEYSELLLENKIRLEEITQEIADFQEQARQTVIDVQDLIRETLEGQQELQQSMLDGRVSLEDTILEVIKSRQEKEKELAIETAEAKIEALQEEIDAIDDLIEERRKLIEEEEEAAEIAELEAKIARIAADPTRRKEMLQLQEELANKRKDMAWKTYEEEMEAQKESLGEQITSLEDYIEYVENYYEELFKNPTKLIEEMESVMQLTDDKIIEWLCENYDEYSTYTDAKKQQMVGGWQQLINQMKGVAVTYNEEIGILMGMTDDEIIEWLKQQNIDFQNATAEQQASFLNSWRETLAAWRNAFRDAAGDVGGYTQPPTGSGTGSSGGGGGGSSGGGSGNGGQTKYSGTAEYEYKGANGKWGAVNLTRTSTVSKDDAINQAKAAALNMAKSMATASWSNSNSNIKDMALAAIARGSAGYIKFMRAYKDGGLAFDTGPAWLDGTRSKPERVLSAYQTQLFEDMIRTLHEIKTINVGGIISGKAPNVKTGGGSFNIESIQVVVENLDSDADYEEMAERVGEKLKEQILKGMPVGGIII